ncbi:MAG: M48 family metallopeptidase [Candidatus Vogelbacteria bacterium]|nr:M48 family metallopeptidase [Candidatus Vogelbacteria bacterium]
MRRLIMAILVAVGCWIGSSGCATVEGTNRKQLMLISGSQELQLGENAWRVALASAQPSHDETWTRVIRRVGPRIAAVSGHPDFDWEFRLFESGQVNAFCLPGGKVAFYSAIMPILQNEGAVAVVMGHEVAHAIARHGAERVSQAIAVQIAARVASSAAGQWAPQYADSIMNGFGLATTLGVTLPFSREQEGEADYLGLQYAARAGYDPREGVAVWQRMGAYAKRHGGKPPEFLSTHPSDEHRVAKMEKYMNDAMALYATAPTRYERGEDWSTRVLAEAGEK